MNEIAIITAFWKKICWLIFGNHSNFGNIAISYIIYCKYVAKIFSGNTISLSKCTFNVIYRCENCSKSEICSMQLAENSLSRLLVLFIFMLFCLEFMSEIHLQRKNLILSSLDCVLTWRLKQCTKWTAKVANTNRYE